MREKPGFEVILVTVKSAACLWLCLKNTHIFLFKFLLRHAVSETIRTPRQILLDSSNKRGADGGAYSKHRGERKCIKSLEGTVERQTSLGRPSCGREGNIRSGGMDSIDLAQDRDQWRALLNTVIKLRVT
jgi:hypothetical protein